MDDAAELLAAFEGHRVDGIRRWLAAGHDPNVLLRGKPPLDLLIEMYTRSDRFVGCLRAMIDAGAHGTYDDLLPVLFDVSPISFAQFGRLPQFHRTERDTWDAVSRLLIAAGRPVPPFDNVPNRYLA